MTQGIGAVGFEAESVSISETASTRLGNFDFSSNDRRKAFRICHPCGYLIRCSDTTPTLDLSCRQTIQGDSPAYPDAVALLLYQEIKQRTWRSGRHCVSITVVG